MGRRRGGAVTLGAAGVLQALAAAALFGVASPAAKSLLSGVGPVMLAGILYLGAGLGLSVWWLARRVVADPSARPEAGLAARDLPLLCVAVAAGGILGPVLQMIGLARTPASTASLFLNLEVVFTTLLAGLVFREHLGRRVAAGMALVVAGGVTLSWTGRLDAVPWGSLAIVGACLAWAIDNNVTRRIAHRDPVQIAAVKGVIAGAFSLALAFAAGGSWPARGYVAGAALLGIASYGASLVLFVLALRQVGTARTIAYFSLAPFVGAAVSWGALGEEVSLRAVLAALLMAAGISLLVRERHEHPHRHEATDHDHRHRHDEHHRHAHGPHDPPGSPHAHPHHHDAVVHGHRHLPDEHHRHSHGG